MYYKNISSSTKTFYGTTFKPNETHYVNGYINYKGFIRVDEPREQRKSQSVSRPIMAQTKIDITKPIKTSKTSVNQSTTIHSVVESVSEVSQETNNNITEPIKKTSTRGRRKNRSSQDEV